ncbi:saccharopine dehydrogenase [Colwellia psychrerythraea]|uniref:Saccharopine dehydrogenase [NAD(+), L-lysine-forming] n=1 Tax=Colwellia psychrerythraea TaxID=28229 RepID=A0A099KNC1_COLPS|nr:saccharopine dehydrogenase [Colwellia psychrerythraea]KGJ92264.1 Saccharopine dehydrogenase (NAD(+), L-lysine-forming) [Colwellia psychrerythraea]
MTQTHLWLRAESKPQEQRTALTPQSAKQLLEAGFKVTIESSRQSIFSLDEYQSSGVEIAAEGSWVNAPSNAIILALKELPEDKFPLSHQHIYFAHAYKEQEGWQALLNRFTQGQGKLLDLEYLVDNNNRRIAAFGYWAGFAGAALAVMAWVNQQAKVTPPLADINSYASQQILLKELSDSLAKSNKKPKVLVIGAKGRSGSGAVALAKALDLETIEWDIKETKKGGPFLEILTMDILVNCVFINEDLPPFITKELLDDDNRSLAIIADVSCDPYGSYNPLPIYHQCTTFKSPCISIIAGEKPLNLIAIDHLPSLLPKESSEDYGQQLVTHLLTLNDQSQGVWPKALDLFNNKTAAL